MVTTLRDFQDILETDLQQFVEVNGCWTDEDEYELYNCVFVKTYDVKGEEIGFPASVFLHIGNNGNLGNLEAKLTEVKRGKDGYTVRYEIL